MTKLHVCAPSYYGDDGTKPLELLMRSCEENGIALHAYGIGKRWITNWECKLDGFLEHLKTVQEPYVLQLDGCDTLVMAQDFEILGAVVNKKRVTISAEKGLYPLSLKELEWPETLEGYRYVNSGCIIGPVEEMRECVKDILAHKDEIVDKNCDQEGWGRLYNRGGCELDSQCFLCQNMSQAAHFDVKPKGVGDKLYMFNHVTRTFPRIAHWSGRMGGRKEWYERLKQPISTPAQ